MELTEGHLLGGRVRYIQPRTGFRSGIEPVLLAAAVPAARGDRVLEGGTGAGAALLCLAARVPGIAGVGLERNAALAALAQRNVEANGQSGLTITAADLTLTMPPGPFDHAFANPPWNDPDGTISPDPSRRAAKRAAPGLLAAWTRALAASLRPRGTLTLILPAARLAEAISTAAEASCAPTVLFPLWPKPGRPAKLILLRAIRQGRGPLVIHPGLVLHGSADRFTPEAEAIFRNAQALPL